MCVLCPVPQLCPSYETRTVACQAPLTMGFPRQEYWTGCHFLIQGVFRTRGSNPRLLHLLHGQAVFLPLCRLGLGVHAYYTCMSAYMCKYTYIFICICICMCKYTCIFIQCINIHTFFPPGFFCEGWKTKSPR